MPDVTCTCGDVQVGNLLDSVSDRRAPFSRSQ